MARAKITAFTLEVETDLSMSKDIGPAVTTVSATANAPVYHRITPYFVRPRRGAKSLKVAFSCSHTAGESVEYAETSEGDVTLPQSASWEGDLQVDIHRLRRNGSAKHRAVTVTDSPGGKASRQIDCNFWVIARRDLERQHWTDENLGWVEHPNDDRHRDNCYIDYKIAT